MQKHERNAPKNVASVRDSYGFSTSIVTASTDAIGEHELGGPLSLFEHENFSVKAGARKNIMSVWALLSSHVLTSLAKDNALLNIYCI